VARTAYRSVDVVSPHDLGDVSEAAFRDTREALAQGGRRAVRIGRNYAEGSRWLQFWLQLR